MNTIDGIIAVIILFNLILGAVRGAVWQVLRIASIVLGVAAAARYGEEFLALAPESLGISASTGIHLARVALFLSVYLVMLGVTNLAKKIIEKIQLGSWDRLIGAGLGAAKGAFFCCLALYLQLFPILPTIVQDHLRGNSAQDIPRSEANAIFLDYVKDRIDELVPDETRERISKVKDDLSEKLVPEVK